MLHVVIEKEVFCHLTFLQSMLMISLMNFDNLDMVFALLRCLWAVSSMLMTLSCSLVTATYLLRLSSSRAFGHIGQHHGAILNGQLQHIQTSSHLKSTVCKSCWKVLRHVFLGAGVLLYACHPLESRILPLSPLDDLVRRSI